ncbi:MAG TPA: GDSL-type esterase/lipase family protein [Beijerinckiaceae bacterium]|nr:GDSL-type esterase/lipase family protein [Beijerinckiaceae bacterium]
MKHGILAAGLVCLAGAAGAAEVVALGASNTEGRGRGATPDGVPQAQAFPAQLQALLRSEGCKAKVLNAGVAGDTTGGMLRRLPRVLGKDTKVLILQPGGNDARHGESGNTASNIAAMRSHAEARGVTVVMMERLQAIAGSNLLGDGVHYNAQGHAQFAAYVLPEVRAAACR